MKNLFPLLLLALLAAAQVNAQRTTPIGTWKTIDDNTGKARSIVEITEQNGALFGTIKELLNPSEPNPVCDECDEDDPRYNKPITGMTIIRNMEKDDDQWTGGDILDPENGEVYRCKVWLEDGNLKVRGYVAFFYRTQTWYPVER